MNRVPSSALSIPGVALAAALAFAAMSPAELYPVRSAALQQTPQGPLPGPAAAFDFLGTVGATGDFDGDGYDDVAMTERETIQETGQVHVLYGGPDGLDADGSQLWQDFDPATLLLDREAGDLFGWAMAAGDFDGDGRDDLAIGVPGETIEDPNDDDVVHGGVVLVVYGSAEGLQTGFEPGTLLPRRFELGAGGIGGGPPTAEESFGSVLAAGDFSGDGRDDLAIGIPERRSAQNEASAGAVLVIYGSSTGLAATGHLFLDQDSDIGGNPMLGTTGPGDQFGYALAAGDFDIDGRDDLAVGVVGETNDVPGGGVFSGAVQVLYGTLGGGLVTAGNQLWHEGNVATGETPEFNDQFGRVLAAGDLTGDGSADLVIGTPFEDFAGVSNAGSITYLVGGEEVGISTLASEVFYEEDFPVSSNPELNDEFGSALAIGDFIEDIIAGRNDLLIGIPGDNVWNGFSSVADVGSAIATIGGVGLGPNAARLWAPGRGGLAGVTTAGQSFGKSFAAGDFDGDGHGDVVVGAPWVDQAGTESAGALFYLRGALFSDGFETQDDSAWTLSVP